MNSWIIKFALIAGIFFACDMAAAIEKPAGKIRVFVSILPQVYFVGRVGGPLVDVDVLVGPGQSPATYEPTPKQMVRLSRAQLYFRIGTPFENAFIRKISGTFENLEIVDTRKNVPLRYFRQSGESRTPDPHIWLDPKRVKIQAKTICEALSHVDPVHAADFMKNLLSFQADLDRIDARIAADLAQLAGKTIYVFHPAFGYFCDSYGLNQKAVEIEGKEPSPRQLARLIENAKRDGVRVIFVQAQYAKRDIETIARAIGGAVVPMNPLPRDYLKSLEEMAAVIKKALARK